MLACRTRPRCSAALSFLGVSPTRFTSTATKPVDKTQDSIFTTPESPWDHVFSDLEPGPTSTRELLPRSDNTNATSAPTPSGRKKGHDPSANVTLTQRSSGIRQRRASLTAREMSVFDEMFDMIFNAVSAQDGKAKTSASASSASSPSATASPLSSVWTPSSVAGRPPGIGRASAAPLDDLFRTLRRHTSRVRWTTAIDEELDRKKETMELFNTDHDLLQWVTTELFGEIDQWDDEAKRAIARKEEGKVKDRSTLPKDHGRAGKHSIYPHLIAHAMRIFRTTYANPSLSLAIFQHAARLSIPSYVFGCTAPAYNELIEARWEGWGDLEGVCGALEEMRANGVKMDGRTRIVVEKVRREIGEARPLDVGDTLSETAGEGGHVDPADAKDVNPLARKVWVELGEADVMKLVHRIERLALRDRPRKSTSSPHEESWKSAALLFGEGDDNWSFDRWEKETKNGQTHRQRRKTKLGSQEKQDSRTPGGWTAQDTSGGEMAFR